MDKSTKTTTDEKRYAEVNAKLSVLEKELLAARQENESLRSKLASLANASPAARAVSIPEAPTVTVDKQTYRVVSGIIHEGEKYTREDLAKNKDLIKLLIARGSTALVTK
jgi:hypothetical protein